MVARFSEISLAKESLRRCLEQPGFLERFYELFMDSSPVVYGKLKHMNMAHQKIMVKSSLHIMMAMASGGLQQQKALQELAELHSRRQKDVRPELYDLWLDAMIKAAGESDPQFNAQIEQAWRIALMPGIEFMKSRY